MCILNRSNIIRLLTTVTLLLALAPVFAQEQVDSVFTFRFFPGKNEFYAPGLNNGAELARLFDCVDRHKDSIEAKKIMLYVDTYCASKKSEAGNQALARMRGLRVKSELITRKGLKEHNFLTKRHTDRGEYVTVRLFTVPGLEPLPVPVEEAPEIAEVVEETAPADTVVVIEPEPEVIEPEIIQPEIIEEVEEVVPLKKYRPDSRFALKTNLLGYVVLMPNIELEWKFIDRWSIALEAQSAWWHRSDPRWVYRVATWTPEVRYWVIERSRWHGLYVGAFGAPGIYDLSGTKKGHKGEGWMAGLSVGYMWPIGKHFSLDAGIGLGYMHARDKQYTPLDGHYLYQLTKNVNYFGPLRAKLSLVWRIPSTKTQWVNND